MAVKKYRGKLSQEGPPPTPDSTHTRARDAVEQALSELREQTLQVPAGCVADLADQGEQERLRGVLRLAEGVLRLAVTRARTTKDGRLYIDPDIASASRCVELVAKVLGVLEIEAKAPVQLSFAQLSELMRRAGFDLVKRVETTGEDAG
jgi:hypothetical protein